MNPGHTVTPDFSKTFLNIVLSTLFSQQISSGLATKMVHKLVFCPVPATV